MLSAFHFSCILAVLTLTCLSNAQFTNVLQTCTNETNDVSWIIHKPTLLKPEITCFQADITGMLTLVPTDVNNSMSIQCGSDGKLIGTLNGTCFAWKFYNLVTCNVSCLHYPCNLFLQDLEYCRGNDDWTPGVKKGVIIVSIFGSTCIVCLLVWFYVRNQRHKRKTIPVLYMSQDNYNPTENRLLTGGDPGNSDEQ